MGTQESVTMPMPLAVEKFLKFSNLILWECFCTTTLVWAMLNYNVAGHSAAAPRSLEICFLIGGLWLISKNCADVHCVITLTKMLVTASCTVPEGLARLAGQFGGGFCACFIQMIFWSKDAWEADLTALAAFDPIGKDKFCKFIFEGVASAVVCFVFFRMEKSSPPEFTALFYSGIMYALRGWLTNPAVVVGASFLKPDSIEDFDDIWYLWFGPLLGAPGYGLLVWMLTGQAPWIFQKFCCKQCNGVDEDADPAEALAKESEAV